MIPTIAPQTWKSDVGLVMACAKLITAQRELSSLTQALMGSRQAASQLARLMAPPIAPLQLASLGAPLVPLEGLLPAHQWPPLSNYRAQFEIQRPVLLTNKIKGPSERRA